MTVDADDLDAGAGSVDGGTEGTEGADAKGAAVVSSEADKGAAKGADDKGGGKAADGDKGEKGADKGGAKTVADGADPDETAKAKAAKEAEDTKAAEHATRVKEFREALAKHASAGDKKAYDKELKRLERLGIERPEQVYGLYRELEGRTSGAGLVKVPGKDAKPEEVAEFNKALGVPEKAEDYLKDLKLENGAVIGEADKPIVGTFTEAMHKVGAPPAAVKAALGWYYDLMAQQEADRADADDEALRVGVSSLKEELGGGYKRETAALKSLFDMAPGGADDKNPNSLYSQVMTARTPDGRMLGNNLEFLKQLIAWRKDIRPFATVTEDGAGSAKSAEARLEEIRALRKTDNKKYLSNEIQTEELRLIESLMKDKAQAQA
jgi:hypothetical protein